MARFEPTDFEGSLIEPLLPTKVSGVPRADDRKALNGIFWRLGSWLTSIDLDQGSKSGNLTRSTTRALDGKKLT